MMNLLIIGAVFVGVVTLIVAVAGFVRGPANSMAESRLNLITGAATAAKGGPLITDTNLVVNLEDGTNAIERFFVNSMNLKRYLMQADISMSPARFLVTTAALGMGGTLLPPIIGCPLLLAPLIGGTLAMLPPTWVWWKRGRRMAAFGRQLPEALELISRALRAGHSLASGISLVAEEMNDPIRYEFERVYEAQNLGRPLEESLEELTDRVPNLDLRFFVTAVILQRQTGGDLAEILDKIGHLVRERFKIFGQIQALTGEGRLSGVVLLALPPVLFVVMYRLNPEYAMVLFTDPMGQKMLAVAVIMQFLGALVIKKIIDIKV
jgi:tight adherence protein B